VFPVSPFTGLFGFAAWSNQLVPDRGLRRLLRQHLRLERLDDAPITLHVVATDVLTDAEVQLSQGNAKDAIMASAAIPGIFPPVRIGARPLTDSGVAETTPIGHGSVRRAERAPSRRHPEVRLE
jgi:NTE family protein